MFTAQLTESSDYTLFVCLFKILNVQLSVRPHDYTTMFRFIYDCALGDSLKRKVFYPSKLYILYM